MSDRINRTIKHLAAAVIGLLGFASCSEDGLLEDTPVLCMYGTPQAAFKAAGSVKDQNGKPI